MVDVLCGGEVEIHVSRSPGRSMIQETKFSELVWSDLLENI